jgi:hypothetical protein
MSDLDKIKEQFEKIAQELFVQENKIYTAGLLVPRFKEAANRLRHDLTINQAAFVIEQMAKRQPTKEITASDIKQLGDKFYTASSVFTEEFSDLIEQEDQQAQKQASRIAFAESTRHLEWDGKHSEPEVDIYKDESIKSLIDPSLSITEKEASIIRAAAILISEEFKALPQVRKTSSILRHKTDSSLVFQTKIKLANEHETDVFVPVELNNEVPLFPQVFSDTEQVFTLDSDGLENLTAEVERKVRQKQSEFVGGLRTAEDFEIALRNDSMGRFSEEVDEYEVEAPKVASLQHSEIENILINAVKTKESKYSPQAHIAGADLVATELKDIGFSNPQVQFNGDYENGLTFKADVNTEAGSIQIELPVEVLAKSSTMLPPAQFKAAGKVYDLSKNAVTQVARLSKTSSLSVSEHPLLFALSYPDLKKQLKTAAHQKMPKLAQKIIATIDEKFGEYYRNAATDDYQTWLEESSINYTSRCGGCDHFSTKTSQAHNDYCNLIKTAAKNVEVDAETQICVRSTYAEAETPTFFDNGQSIKITWED